ncbi:MAG: FMN reductase (NADPH) [Candidatus Scalindua arabica]|uniref:FMN reductase (NADPH) n=1 Tax=Candidatus Scalindua arabica TaxID=1127984 RepID=A0A941W503_9BACT|nr:FMN reductase (NADPH) [Candidatus Scalindua arabica]
MNVYEAIIKRRTIRRFKQKTIPFETLKKLVNAGRLAPSSANLQPIEYIVIDGSDQVEKVFGTLKWAGYISPAGNPPPGEKPVAYIIVLANKKKNPGNCERDAAAAIENMILVAMEEGIGSCWLGSIDFNKLTDILELPEHIKIDSVLALGYSNESPRIEEIKDSVKYWKDETGTLHVPKRKINDVLFYNKYST